MGIIRTLLALSVLFTHAGGLDLAGGRNAVQIFYLISGFLISYVLVERKSYSSTAGFYASRYLRLFPQYFIIATLTLVTFEVFPVTGAIAFFDAFNSLGPTEAVLLSFSNAFLFGQDWLMFTKIEGGGLVATPSFRDAALPAYHALLMPQAWTLGVELTFYVLAPFVLPRRKLLLGFLAASIAVRITLIIAGIGLKDPWTYRFFPAELMFFLSGACIHQFGLARYKKMSRRYDLFFTIAIISFILSYPFIPGHELLKSALLISASMLALPALFRFQHGREWDVAIGDLSYPIYINHVLVIGLLELSPLEKATPAFAIVAAALSIAAAVAMEKWIAIPVERARRRLRGRGGAEPGS